MKDNTIVFLPNGKKIRGMVDISANSLTVYRASKSRALRGSLIFGFFGLLGAALAKEKDPYKEFCSIPFDSILSYAIGDNYEIKALQIIMKNADTYYFSFENSKESKKQFIAFFDAYRTRNITGANA